MENRTPPMIFSKERRSARAARAAGRQLADDAARFMLDAICEDLAERLAFMRFSPKRALVLGDLTGNLTAQLVASGADVADLAIGELAEEQPYPHGEYDLIISVNALDTINDLPGALIHMRAALAEGGLTIAALPAAGSLPQLRAAMLAGDGDRPAARLHPVIDAQAGAALMQRAGFARQVADSYTLHAAYSSLDRLVNDLRDQGLGNVLTSISPPVTKAGLKAAREAFDALRGADDRTVESFEILTLTGWKS